MGSEGRTRNLYIGIDIQDRFRYTEFGFHPRALTLAFAEAASTIVLHLQTIVGFPGGSPS
jgi:hypothetical protein